MIPICPSPAIAGANHDGPVRVVLPCASPGLGMYRLMQSAECELDGIAERSNGTPLVGGEGYFCKIVGTLGTVGILARIVGKYARFSRVCTFGEFLYDLSARS